MTPRLSTRRWSRRGFIVLAGGAVTVVTTGVGSLVGFVPRAYAQGTGCDFGVTYFDRGCKCRLPPCKCTGPCIHNGQSCCQFGPRPDLDRGCIACAGSVCNPAKAFCFCNTDGRGYCCGQLC
jgi:hypothetical protein